MNAEIDIENATCNARYLAMLFDTTSRNIGYMVERGMPVHKYGKAGRRRTFMVPWALYWYVGWKACRTWEKQLPDTLETVLTGYAIDNEYPEFSFVEWMERAKALASDMGYSDQAFDKAVQYLIAHNLIQWRKRRF